MEDHAAVAHGVEGGLRERRHAHEPLLGEQRLHERVAAIAVRDLVRVVLHAEQEPARLQIRDDLLARLADVETRIGTRVVVEPAVGVQDVDRRQTEAAAALEVVRVVRRRHLHGAGAEVSIHEGVGDDRDLAVEQGQARPLADQAAPARVVGVHGDRRVAEQRLGPRRLDLDRPGAVRQRVADPVELAGHRSMRRLEVREHGGAARAPGDEVLGAVDQALVVEADEDLAHGARETRIHREALAFPVAGATDRVELLHDARAVLGLPFPDLIDEEIAAEVVARLAALGEVLFDHHLGRDAGVIRARHPQHVEALQALVAGQQVLERVVEGVAEVQGSRHVGRRDHHREARPVVVGARVVEAAVEPGAHEARLDGSGFESLGKFCRHGAGILATTPDRSGASGSLP